MWLCAKYHFASTFSYRIPNFSTSYAVSSIAPSPSTVKLSIVSTIINRAGDIDGGKNIFEKIKTAEVKLEPARLATTFKVFIKRLKKARDPQKILESTFAVREYTVFDSPLMIYMDIDKEIEVEVASVLRMIQYFGSSDSLCFCQGVEQKIPPNKRACKKVGKELPEEGLIFLLTDFTSTVKFENINSFNKEHKLVLGKHIVQSPYLFPLAIKDRGKNHTTYELKPFANG